MAADSFSQLQDKDHPDSNADTHFFIFAILPSLASTRRTPLAVTSVRAMRTGPDF
jgi:hypothetical protein